MLTFQTEDLIVRPLKISDCANFLLSHNQRSPSTSPFDVGYIGEIDKKYFYDYLTFTARLMRSDKIYVLGVFEKATANYVGFMEFIIYVRANIDFGSFGMSFSNQFFGNGYGNQLTALAPQIARELSLRRLECAIEVENLPSLKMVKKCGFEYEGMRKGFLKKENSLIDMEIFYLTLD